MRRAQAKQDLSSVSNADYAEQRETYYTLIRLVERLHRQFLELVDAELDRLHVIDINNVQSLILFNIGTDEATIGELITRGYYLGSNVSYNVRKLVEAEYLVQERSVHDRRSSRVKLSSKGLELFHNFERMFDRHIDSYSDVASAEDLRLASSVFKRLGEFWGGQTGYPGRHAF